MESSMSMQERVDIKAISRARGTFPGFVYLQWVINLVWTLSGWEDPTLPPFFCLWNHISIMVVFTASARAIIVCSGRFGLQAGIERTHRWRWSAGIVEETIRSSTFIRNGARLRFQLCFVFSFDSSLLSLFILCCVEPQGKDNYTYARLHNHILTNWSACKKETKKETTNRKTSRFK